MEIYSKNEYVHISSATTTQVLARSGVLLGISVNSTAAGTVTIYNDPAATTSNVVGILKANIAEGYYPFNVSMGNGIKIVTGSASDLTVIFRNS